MQRQKDNDKRKREQQRREGTRGRDCKLAGATAEHFLWLVEAKLRAAGSGARYVRISLATNPSAAHTRTHTLSTCSTLLRPGLCVASRPRLNIRQARNIYIRVSLAFSHVENQTGSLFTLSFFLLSLFHPPPSPTSLAVISFCLSYVLVLLLSVFFSCNSGCCAHSQKDHLFSLSACVCYVCPCVCVHVYY